MRCTSPRTVGFLSDGKTLCWSSKKYSKEFAPFQLPCGKCLSCRLENARQTAIRCVHEASLYEENSFLTLTYSDEHIGNGKLRYSDIQKFTKGVRNYRFQKLLNNLFPVLPQKEQRQEWKKLPKERRDELYETIRISLLITGEYGDKTKRPHWHLLVFNWRPEDCIHKYTTDRGDKVYTSVTLGELWTFGIAEVGAVTFESAGYCARYATKKLVHGKDGEHDFNPISRRSAKNAIGKKWIEKYWKDVFDNGFLVFKKGDEYIQCGIPRYYEKWLQKNRPKDWEVYVTGKKQKIIDRINEIEMKQKQKELQVNAKRGSLKGHQISKNKVRDNILKSKIKTLSNKL